MAKFCTNCGNELEDGASFCSNCGTSATPSGNQSSWNQSSMNWNSNDSDRESEGAPTWLKVISFLFPIIGFILYFVYKGENLKKANDCAKFAWIGFGVNIVLLIFGAA